MFIRQTKTSNSTTGESYVTLRLVASERVGKQVRQRTLLNLGRQFNLAKDEWPLLCSRIEQILSGQGSFLTESAARNNGSALCRPIGCRQVFDYTGTDRLW